MNATSRIPTASRPLSCLCLALTVAAFGLAGCDRRSESNPGATPAAVGSGTAPSGRTDAGTPSSGVDVATPAAPDARGGGSTGAQGVVPVPDTSGGPYSGNTTPGAAKSGPPPAGAPVPAGTAHLGGAAGAGTADRSPSSTTNSGAPASALGNAASNGNTNSTPQSSTGNR